MSEVFNTEVPGKCYICSNPNIVHIPTRNPQYHHEYGDDMFLDRQIYYCDKCQFSFSYPFVPESELSTFYSTGFVKRRRTGKNWKRTWFKDWIRNKQPDVRALVKLILAKQHMGVDQISNVCEIGGANPSSFETWRNFGVDADYYSVESPGLDNSIFKEHGINIITADITRVDSNMKTDFFDIVLSDHVLEHFNANKLDIVVSNVYGSLRRGGLFIVDVPYDNLSSFVDIGIRNQGCHLVHYQEKSLKLLLQNAGFEILYLERSGPAKIYLDNIPYPEGDFKPDQPEDKLYWDVKKNRSPNTGILKKTIKRHMPFASQVIPIVNAVRGSVRLIFKKVYTIQDLFSYSILEKNSNGGNIKVCCRKA